MSCSIKIKISMHLISKIGYIPIKSIWNMLTEILLKKMLTEVWSTDQGKIMQMHFTGHIWPLIYWTLILFIKIHKIHEIDHNNIIDIWTHIKRTLLWTSQMSEPLGGRHTKRKRQLYAYCQWWIIVTDIWQTMNVYKWLQREQQIICS